jgi:hypothetical protein
LRNNWFEVHQDCRKITDSYSRNLYKNIPQLNEGKPVDVNNM